MRFKKKVEESKRPLEYKKRGEREKNKKGNLFRGKERRAMW